MAITTKEPVNIQKMIEKFTGTEYDTLLAIYQNLPELLSLEASVNTFTQRFIGVLESAPTTRKDGKALEEGDYYFDSVAFSTFYFVGGRWVNANSTDTSIYQHTVEASDIVGDDTVIKLAGVLSPLAQGNMVFVSSAYQYDREINPDGAYEVTDSDELTFVDAHLQVGEIVTVIVGVTVTTFQPYISIKEGYYVAETADQVLIPLPDGIKVAPGSVDIQVYHNQKFLTRNVHYVVQSEDMIELVDGADVGDLVHFIQGGIAATLPDTETDVITLPLISSVMLNKELLGESTDKVLIVMGGYTVADGSAGIYIYDESFPRNKANGVTAIDPTKEKIDQGNNIGNGCWIRQYEGLLQAEWFNSPAQGIASLRYCKALPDDRVTIDGFYEDSVKGGGMFVWDSTRDSSDHNGGTVVSPLVVSAPGTAGWYTAPAPGTQGCWVKMVNNPTAEDFGAGQVDDSNAFTAMESTGLKIQLGSSAYSVSSNFTSGNFYSIGAVTVSGGGSINYIDLTVEGLSKEADIKEVSTDTYTLIESDTGKILHFTHVDGCQVTAPGATALPFDKKIQAVLVQKSSNAVAVSGDSDSTIHASGNLVTSGGINSMLSIYRYAANEYQLGGERV